MKTDRPETKTRGPLPTGIPPKIHHAEATAMAYGIKARLTVYSNGQVEMGWSRQPVDLEAPLPRLADSLKMSPLRHSDDMPEGYADGSLERAGRRAKGVVRRIAKEHRFDYLVTLTSRANQDDYDVALAMLRAFLRVVRRTVPGYACLAVPERQARGAWHWHLAVSGWQNLHLLRHAWGLVCDHYLYGGGNVDVKAPKDGGHGQWANHRLAGYLCKYIVKGMEEDREGLKGRHRYVAPLGLKTWGEFTVTFPGDYSLEELLRDFHQFLGMGSSVASVWVPADQDGVGWMCSA